MTLLRHRWLRVVLALWLLAGATGGLALPGRAGPVAVVAAEPSLDEVLDGVQGTLDARAAAERSRSRDAFTATIDPRGQAATFRRIQQQWFDAGSSFGPYRATRAKAMPNDYYKVWVRAGFGSEAVWTFKQLDGRWLVTEPSESELGKRVVAQSDHFMFRYYEWDADVIDSMVATLERAYTRVTTLINVQPDRKMVYLSPTYAVDPLLWEPFIVAMGGQGTMHLHSIESFGGGFYDANAGPAESIYPTIVHEYTHLVNDEIVSLQRMPWWMTEGLAEYAAESFRTGEVASAAAGDRLFNLDKCHEVIFFRNEKNFTPSEVSLAYGESAYAVRWIAERWGIDAFWAVAKEYDKSRDFPSAVQHNLGQSWDQTQTDFLTWVKQQVS